MAKKKNEEPVYPAAPLVISKEKFVGLLQSQIDKGKELLEIIVPLKTQQNPFYGYSGRNNDRVEYDEVAEKDFFAKFNRWHDRNKEIYRSSFEVPNSIYYHDYESQVYPPFIIVDIVKDYKEDISRLINQMQTDIERVDLMRCNALESETFENNMDFGPKGEKKERKMNQVFVVYGHDELMKLEVEKYLKDELNLDVIALDEKPNQNKTIIEKFEFYSKDAGFAVVLMSPDDTMEVDGQIYKQARQNVVLEMGYFMAKLGRSNVSVLLKGEVEKPSDISGILHLPYSGNWKFELYRELKAAGVDC